jgi:hypothetical protein
MQPLRGGGQDDTENRVNLFLAHPTRRGGRSDDQLAHELDLLAEHLVGEIRPVAVHAANSRDASHAACRRSPDLTVAIPKMTR